MYGEEKPEMQCGEFEALLTEALDDTLTSERRQAFEAHCAACANCAPLYAAAQSGLSWLKELQLEQVEPPARLMDNILRATSWANQPEAMSGRSWWQRLRELPGLAPIRQTLLQPRFAMAFAMAFFSISLLYSISGFQLRNLLSVNLRPSVVVRQAYEAQGKLVKYYENIRWVYEIESRVRELKRSTTPEEPASQPEKQDQQDNRSRRPEPNNYRNSTLEEARPLLAQNRGGLRASQGDWL